MLRALCAIAQAESLRFKLLQGLAVRRACYGVVRYIMENGAKGVEVVVSGKLRGARAKAMKFKDGYMVKSGNAVNHYVDSAVRNILLKQGVLGIKVSIMLPHDPAGKIGPRVPLSDVVIVRDPKEEETNKVANVSALPSGSAPVAPRSAKTAAPVSGGAPAHIAPHAQPAPAVQMAF